MPAAPPRREVSATKLTIGAVLIALGVVLWIMTGQTAYGLVSGLGVVFSYIAAEPWLERWRKG